MTIASELQDIRESLDTVMQKSKNVLHVCPDHLSPNLVALRKYLLNGLQTLNNLEEKIDVAVGAIEVKNNG